MKKLFIAAVLLVFNLSFSQKNDNKVIKQKIDSYIKEVIEINEIPGVALAVIKDGKVLYENYFGKASLENNKAVDKNTVFRLFSTTKLITNVAVFQLIEGGKLSLEDPISKYLDYLPKEWQGIKIENLLSHSSGLPNIVAFDDIPITLPYKERIAILATKPMDFVTGDENRYNQTNYLFLTKIIEKITGLTYDEYALQNQFAGVQSDVHFSSDGHDVFVNGGIRYNYNSKTKKYEQNAIDFGVDAHSANGLVVSLPEFIRWNQNLDQNKFLKEDTKNSMWKPFPYKDKDESFAYGWGIYPLNKILSYGFTGGNETAFRKFVKNDMTIIFLSNGHKYSDLYVQSQVINHVAGIVDKTLIDEYFLAGEKINQNFLKLPIAKAEENYLAVKKNHPDWDFQYRLNIIGYTLMNYDRINDAIKVFELNTKENPTSANALNSLAECYFNNNKFENAKQYYKKSLELAPDNTNSKEMLDKIEKLMTKRS